MLLTHADVAGEKENNISIRTGGNIVSDASYKCPLRYEADRE